MRADSLRDKLSSMTDDEKSYWRIYAAIQELIRVTDEDVDKNPELRKLIHAVANVARLYRTHGADEILNEQHTQKLESMGIPVIKPKRPKK